MKTLMSMVAIPFLSAAMVVPVYADDVKEKQKDLLEKQQELSKTQEEVHEKQIELNQANKEVSIERAQEANKSMQQVSRASKITGAKVKNTTGDSLGDIKDLVIDPENGQVVYAVVSFGGLMGMGDKLFAIPWRALHWTSPKDYYVLDLDKDTLKKAPGFDKKHWPENSEKWEEQREALGQFYRVTP
ncbi:PRC-barrel domain-containing protein [Methylomonas montana]|uniref:PRC-barrel domain-containing protein n=1 Tax=Methylomonas montana TaxID=3058963 RepID=UPI002659E6F7|nr:PRC-barrel domain-containing protein [Methylomonas montana]WKJ92268.1 PRC-barrel domain-containing protein [Methylomonas montana]